jgi:tetratricopeptide (TPR) repeat protein
VAHVAHVFISYSKKHRELTERVAALLESQSLAGPDGTAEPITVWWDKSLCSGDVFHREITEEIDDARAVVVIWSEGAVASDWVYAEAQRGAGRRKLVPLRDPALPHDRIPLPFGVFHIDDATNDAAVIASVIKRLGGTPSEDVGGLPPNQRWLLDPKAEAPLDRTARNSPAALLKARYCIAPFFDFGDRREKLLAWAHACDAAGNPTKTLGKVIHGPGGLGKTRLMIEVARALADEGWLAGFVNRDTLGHVTRGPQLESLIRNGREARGLLLVIDYAEGRSKEVETLARLMLERERAGGAPSRLVLLARAAGDWWTELARGSTEVTDVFGSGEETTDKLLLPDIHEGEARVALWTRSAIALKPHLAASFSEVSALDPEAPPPDQQARLQKLRNGPDYARPLAIQMEALLWLRGAAPAAHECGIPKMLDRIVGLEREHWKKVTDGVGMDALDRAVAQVTIVQGVDNRAQAIDLLKADSVFFGVRTPYEAGNVVNELAKLYGADGGGAETGEAPGRRSDGLAPLEPDLIGEHLVAEKADNELIDACLRWIGSEPAEAREKLRRNLLTVLQRSTAEEHGAKATANVTALLDHLIAEHVKPLAGDMIVVAIETPGSLIDRLDRQVPKLDEEALAAIDAALPMQSLALMELALHVAERRVELARNLSAAADAAAEDVAPELKEAILAHLAARVGTLGNRLSALGRREDALKASQEAVDIRRRLAQKNPDAFLPDLAMSLNNLGGDLSNLGRREDALTASQEAVDSYRSLEQKNPDAFLPDLAMSLGAHGRVLAGLDRHAEAAAAVREGLAAIAPFVERHPQAFGGLAGTLAQIYIAASDAAGVEPGCRAGSAYRPRARACG